MDKKEQILTTAIKLFVKQGFENTPTSQISKEAKVATGTLFHHFKSKEDLINAAYLYAKQKAVSDAKEGFIDNPDFKKRLKKSFEVMIKWGAKNRILLEFVCRFSNSIYITKLTKKQGHTITEPFTKLLEEGIKSKTFKNLPQETIHQIYFSIYRVVVESFNGKPENKTITDGFNVLWDALKR